MKNHKGTKGMKGTKEERERVSAGSHIRFD